MLQGVGRCDALEKASSLGRGLARCLMIACREGTGYCKLAADASREGGMRWSHNLGKVAGSETCFCQVQQSTFSRFLRVTSPAGRKNG